MITIIINHIEFVGFYGSFDIFHKPDIINRFITSGLILINCHKTMITLYPILP